VTLHNFESSTFYIQHMDCPLGESVWWCGVNFIFVFH
jgi:hypothetical protein